MADTVQTVKVGEPLSPLDAANKKYVDDKTNAQINRYVDINVAIHNRENASEANGWLFNPLGGHISDYAANSQVRAPILSYCEIVQMRIIIDALNFNQQQDINVQIYQDEVVNINANLIIPAGSRQSDIVGFNPSVKMYEGNYCYGLLTRNNGVFPTFASITLRLRYPIHDILDEKEKKDKVKVKI